MNKLIYKLRKLVSILRGRNFAASLLAIMMAFCVYTLSAMTKAVYIKDDGETILKFTTKQDAKDILVDEGIITRAYDVVDASGFSGKVAQISIKRAFQVNLLVDGKSFTAMLTEGNVGDVLDRFNIKLNDMDTVNFSMEKIVEPNDVIKITRVKQNQFTKNETIPHEVIYKTTSVLAPGNTKVLEQGHDGEKQYLYEHTIINSKIVSEKLLSETVLTKPKTSVILKGVKSAPISKLDFGNDFGLDENNVPTRYTKILTNQIATGYSSSGNPKGASGMPLSCGYVAVDPNIIPYGTKMYIASPDNKFVYGYAIAADTGIGIIDGIIDLDLFYDSYYESCQNSKRIVNVYILK